MIRSFGDKRVEDLFHNRNTSRVQRIPPEIRNNVLRKLDIINACKSIEELRSPPSNRLEVLKGDLKGFHSIRINNQWRLIFRWSNGEADEVQLVDYH